MDAGIATKLSFFDWYTCLRECDALRRFARCLFPTQAKTGLERGTGLLHEVNGVQPIQQQIPRLRMNFASRSSCFARDDNSFESATTVVADAGRHVVVFPPLRLAALAQGRLFRKERERTGPPHYVT